MSTTQDDSARWMREVGKKVGKKDDRAKQATQRNAKQRSKKEEASWNNDDDDADADDEDEDEDDGDEDDGGCAESQPSCEQHFDSISSSTRGPGPPPARLKCYMLLPQPVRSSVPNQQVSFSCLIFGTGFRNKGAQAC